MYYKNMNMSSLVIIENCKSEKKRIHGTQITQHWHMHEYLLVLPGFKLRRLSTERLSDLLKGVNDAIAESVIS